MTTKESDRITELEKVLQELLDAGCELAQRDLAHAKGGSYALLMWNKAELKAYAILPSLSRQ